ncbi:nickel transporter [Caulobacter vibrioides]|nr:nickel transporter [Caulobacter vibrioides]
MKTMLASAALLAGLGLSGLAHAHSPYMLPSTFDVSDRKVVTVQGSFTESFFTPEVVMKSDTYAVVGPDGVRKPLTPTYLRELALVEVPVEATGTYRITTGQRAGRVGKATLVNGEWEFLEPGKAPAGAQVVDMQSITTADVYVTRGAPSAGALAPVGKGLEFQAVTHPSDITTGQPAKFVVLYDGKPVAGQEVTLTLGGDRYADAKAAPVTVKSDAQGRFEIKPERSGAYQMQARYRVAPAAEGQPGQSHTYSLTFESLR